MARDWSDETLEAQFTPAALRALESAARWHAENDHEISTPQLLLGLLAEDECRGAVLLSASGIDTAAVRCRWPSLVARRSGHSAPLRLNDRVATALRSVRRRLRELAEADELATEHLLLAAAAAADEAADWLAERGLRAADLDKVILPVAPCQQLPLDCEPRPGRASHRSRAKSPLPRRGAKKVASRQPAPAAGGAKARQVARSTPSPSAKGARERPPSENPARRRRPAIPAPSGHIGSQGSALMPPEPARADANPSVPPAAVLRIIDASANRAREALRTLEDHARFTLDDEHLTGQFKSLRHALQAALESLPAEHLLTCRDTLADVGTEIATTAEWTRATGDDVVAAANKRLQEALRSLEEYGKLAEGGLAGVCRQARYQAYTLEKALAAIGRCGERLGTARLYVLVDGGSSLPEFRRRIARLLRFGVDVVQLRDKRLADRELLARARVLREATRKAGTLFVMNDRPDLAVLSRADGVHVGQDELTIREVRQIIGPEMLVGVSTHSLQQAQAAVLGGASYLGVGPTFASATKSFAEFPGPRLLAEVAARIRLPAFAIGGVTLDNLPQVLASGIRRIAVGGAIWGAADPGQAVRRFRKALDARGR